MHNAIKTIVASIAILSLTDLVWSQSSAQDTANSNEKSNASASAETADTPSKPMPIAAADISPQAEELDKRLREFTKLAGETEEFDEIAIKSPLTTKEIQRLDEKLRQTPPISLRSIEAERKHWVAIDDQIYQWQSTLQERSVQLQSALSDIVAARNVWQATSNSDLPEAVQQQIDTILKNIDKTEADVSKSSDEVLTLQGQFSKLRVTTSNALEKLNVFESNKRSKLFVQDQDPLWSTLTSGERNLTAEIKHSYTVITTSLSEFTKRYKKHFIGHVAIFVTFIILILLARRSVPKELLSDKEVANALIVLVRPYSTALLLSLLILMLFYPISSAEVLQLSRLILIVPMLRLLPKLLPRFHGLITILSFVYVAESIGQLAVEGSLVQRLLILVSSLLAISTIMWGLLKIFRSEKEQQTLTNKMIRLLGWLAILGLVISVLANIIGAMALAALISTAMFNAIWAGVVFKVATNICSALLFLVLRSSFARHLLSVRSHADLIHHRVIVLLSFCAISYWIVLVLSWLEIWQPIFAWCIRVITFEWTVGTIAMSISRIASFVIAIIGTVIVSKLVRFFLEADILQRLNLQRGASATISTLVNYAIIGIGVLLAFAVSGVKLSNLGFIIGALGVGIGFGLRDIVNNFVSGLILIFERPVKVGDLIELTSTSGIITHIGARASIVQVSDGAEVIVPNASLISSEVINWTHSDNKRRTEIEIPIAGDTDPRRVIEILERVARDLPDVLDDPAPYAAFQSFTNQGLVFVLRAWPAEGKSLPIVRTELVIASLYALGEAGIKVRP